MVLVATIATAGLAQTATFGWAVDVIKPKGVVELFTSQGCSSCPPADKVLAEFAREREVLALSWHVDYWDYLGWKDKFASTGNTERQYRYARSLGERNVYTPQAIVNGRAHVIGSKGNQIRNMVDHFNATGSGLVVPIFAQANSDSISVKVPSGEAATGATLWLVYFNNQERVSILRGENTGREITYHNTVHDIQMIGMVKNTGLEMDLPAGEMKRSGYDSCALIVQATDSSGNPGPIVGAVILAGL